MFHFFDKKKGLLNKFQISNLIFKNLILLKKKQNLGQFESIPIVFLFSINKIFFVFL